MNYFEKVVVGFGLFSICVLGLVPLIGALVLSFLTLNVAESFTIIYGQFSWLGVRVVALLLLLLASVFAIGD